MSEIQNHKNTIFFLFFLLESLLIKILKDMLSRRFLKLFQNLASNNNTNRNVGYRPNIYTWGHDIASFINNFKYEFHKNLFTNINSSFFLDQSILPSFTGKKKIGLSTNNNELCAQTIENYLKIRGHRFNFLEL